MRVAALALPLLLARDVGAILSPGDPTASAITETFAFIDEFVEEWKLDNPSLSSDEISRVHATAQKMKDNFSSPPPPPVSAAVQKPANVSLPSLNSLVAPFSNTTNGVGANSTLSRAIQIVRQAQREADSRNFERVSNPRVNTYYDGHDLHSKRSRLQDSASLYINDTVSAAAAIVAAANAANATTVDHSEYILPPHVASKIADVNPGAFITKRSPPQSGTAFWMECIAHTGKVPFRGPSNGNYIVFRNVKDYGAVGDGKTDDTDAINNAMKDGGRCGANRGSSTVKPAIVYFPSGTYRVRQTIPMFYNTQVVGNVRHGTSPSSTSSDISRGNVMVMTRRDSMGGHPVKVDMLLSPWYSFANNRLLI